MQIAVLNDDRKKCDDFDCEHGLSLLLTIGDNVILFDAGQTDLYIKNAKKLNLDLSKVSSIVLSHGDYDHGNGLLYFPLKDKIDLFAHNDIFKNRISKRTGKYDGLNQTKEQLSQKFVLHLSVNPTYIANDIVFLGEIPRCNNFEEGGLPMVDEIGQEYLHHDDSGIAIITTKGLVVISGCAHSGICNTCEYAKKVTGINKIYAVIGGFHLKEINEREQLTQKYFLENNIEHIMLAHCSSDAVCQDFLIKFPNCVDLIHTGEIYEL